VSVRFASLTLAALLFSACSVPVSDESLGRHRNAVIYGEDDRVALSSYGDERYVAQGSCCVGALIDQARLMPAGDGFYSVEGVPLAEHARLCPDEPVANQVSAAVCTATLIGRNRIVTAGHCVSDARLDRLVFVRGFARDDEFPRVSAERVHALERVLALVDGDIATESGADLAIVAVAAPRTLPAVEPSFDSALLAEGDSVVVIGTSEGLPLAVDDGARVWNATGRDYFEITSDTFVGGSGSPVFSSDVRFAGIVVGGALDYTWSEQGECFARRRLIVPEGRAEIVVRSEVIERALDEIDAETVRGAGCCLGRANGRHEPFSLFLLALVTLGFSRRTMVCRRTVAARSRVQG
jgi:hypothetical protein